MPLYEYRCSACDTAFEERRPMSQASDPAQCVCGAQAKRRLSVFASVGGGAPASTPAPAPRGGGCGSGCGCH
ncbi:MAG: zinc ribbon domain-containing protein [Actinobacteria bacterium]|nr:zinc ribbon domain-containing protein [Actinomycetota bacterium]